MTISRDIQSSFALCRDRVSKLLRDHPGKIHFATDTWTSPNHRAFVAWTVHLEHQGHMLAFLLDVVEVPEVRAYSCVRFPELMLPLPQSYSGANLAAAFQAMLERFGLKNKILAFNGDNASQNDMQAVELARKANSFSEDNRIRCFNHAMQLSA